MMAMLTVDFILPLGFEIWSEVEMNLREKINAFDNSTNFTVWNASVEKTVFKDKSGRLKFSLFDILNQNRGFSRTINSNFVSEERYQKLGQYFLVGFEWTFNKMPGGAKAQ